LSVSGRSNKFYPTNSGLFVGREKLLLQLEKLYREGKHVLITGPAGIGKTALLRQTCAHLRFLVCEESTSLGRICDELEAQAGFRDRQQKVVQRKNRLLIYACRRGEPIAFDQVAKATPRITRFIGQLSDRVPVWIVCRSQYAQEIGHLWELVYRFTQIELPPLTVGETRTVLEAAVASQSVQADVLGYVTPLYHLCRGNPRMLEELLVELSARRYRVSNTAGRHLLEIDREIHSFERAMEESAQKFPDRAPHHGATDAPSEK
jgi:hypothetical protein